MKDKIALQEGFKFCADFEPLSNTEIRAAIGNPPFTLSGPIDLEKSYRLKEGSGLTKSFRGTMHCGICGVECFLNEHATELRMNCVCFFEEIK